MSASLFPSFLMTFREAFEAALIVAIVASYLKKIGQQSLNRYLYQGAVAAIGASVLLGLVIREVGSVLVALVGYDGNPEWLRVIVYLGYWLMIGTSVFLTHRKKELS